MDNKRGCPRSESGAQPAAPRGSRIYYGWFVVAASMIISAAAVGVSDSFGLFVLPLEQNFGFSRAQLGIASSIGLLIGGFTQPILGYLFDRLNSRLVILISLAVAGIATVCLSWTSQWWHVAFLYGVVFSIAVGGTSFGILGALAARWFLRRRTLALSFVLSAPTVASIFFAPITGLLLVQYGWRLAWLVLGAILLFLVLPTGLKFLRNWPSEMGLKADGEPESPMEASKRGDAPAAPRGRFEVVRWRQAFRAPPIWVLLTVFAIGGFAVSFVTSFLALFSTESVGVAPVVSGSVLAVKVVLGAIGAIAVGWLADRFLRKKVLGAALLVHGMALLVLIAVQNVYGLFLFAILAGLSGTAWMVIALSLIADIYGLRSLATLWGFAFLFSAIGGVFGPVSGGVAYDFTGSFVLPFTACALMLVLASGMVFAVDERKYSARYQAAI